MDTVDGTLNKLDDGFYYEQNKLGFLLLYFYGRQITI